MSELYIGLNSGTSMDSIDAVLVDFSPDKPNILIAKSYAYSQSLKNQLLSASNGSLHTPAKIAELDVLVGKAFAEACNKLIDGYPKEEIRAIGSHGQTVSHNPDSSPGSTLQLGCPAQISEITQITTISDFRKRDIAAGGQGAPLMPAFHKEYFSSDIENRVILNIGGIANITFIPTNDSQLVLGFDSGPGNCLMDKFIKKEKGFHFDKDGIFASKGIVNEKLLSSLFNDKYFTKGLPKSTGTDYFNISWLDEKIKDFDIDKKDIQATLLQLTVLSISSSIRNHCSPYPSKIFVCGGGAKNNELIKRLEESMTCEVCLTGELGIEVDWVEPVGFAWLARQNLKSLPGNVPSVTGANGQRILGTITPK